MEVISSIVSAQNISMEEVEKARINKRNKKGGFQNKIYLIDVEQEEIDQREEKELNKDWRNYKLNKK